MSGSLIITVQVGHPQSGYPLTADLSIPGQRLQRTAGLLQLALDELTALDSDPAAYGTALGRALFRERIRDGFVRALPQAGQSLRILLTVQDPLLRSLRWDRLHAPLGDADLWRPLAGRPGLTYAAYVPSSALDYFPRIGPQDLRALVVVSSPRDLESYRLKPFDVAAAVGAARAGLEPIPSVVLERPGLKALVTTLRSNTYPILHLVCHGRQVSGGPAIYLGRDDNPDAAAPITAAALIAALSPLAELQRLPHLIFLAACESAAASTSLDGLAQELVRSLGIPAVIAMAGPISVASAELLSRSFYQQLREYRHPDLALSAALIDLAGRADAGVPICLTCDPERPLVSRPLERDLRADELALAVSKLEQQVVARAPALLGEVQRQAQALRSYGTDPVALRQPLAQQTFAALNQLSDELLGLSLNELVDAAPELPDSERCPFPGLEPFRDDGRDFFFGREQELARLVPRMQAAIRVNEAHLLAIGGPSGAGKSSLAHAGIVPALRDSFDGLEVRSLRPGLDPPAALATALAGLAGGPALLIVDQGEELFTLCDDEGRRRAFAEALAAVGVPTILAFRDDYRADLCRYPTLEPWLSGPRLELINPLTPAQLRSVVELQARAAFLQLEDRLGERIFADVAAERWPMPLLQHTLRALWEGRRGRWLRLADYEAIGGIAKAIARTADGLYNLSSHADQALIERVVVELVNFDPTAASSPSMSLQRRRLTRAELLTRVPTAERVIHSLDAARLIVAHENAYELAHEVLLRAWPKVEAWVNAGQELRRRRNRLTEAAAVWKAGGGQNAHLYRGVQLAEALELRASGTLTSAELIFIRASERYARRGLLLAWSLVAVFALLAGLVGVMSIISMQRAERIRDLALVSGARAALSAGERERALALALAAGQTGVTGPELEATLADAAYQPGTFRRIPSPSGQLRAAALSPDGRSVLLAEGDGLISQWNLAESELQQQLRVTGDGVATLAFVDGGRILTGGDDGAVRLWNLASGQPLAVMRGHRAIVLAVAALPDGQRALSAADDRTLRLWELAGGRELLTLSGHQGAVRAIAVSPDGTMALSGGDDGVRLWELAGGRELWFQPAPGVADVAIVAVEGRREALAAVAGAIVRWKLEDGSQIGVLPVGDQPVSRLAVSTAGDRLAAAASDGRIAVWDLANQQLIVNLREAPQGQQVVALAFGPDGRSLFSADGREAAVRLWDLEEHPALSGPTLAAELFAPLPGAAGALLVSDGMLQELDATLGAPRGGVRLAGGVTSPGQLRAAAGVALLVDGAPPFSRLRVFARDTGAVLLEYRAASSPIISADLSPDGARVAIAEGERVLLLRVADGGLLAELPGLQGADLVFSPAGDSIAVGDNTGQVYLLDGVDLHERSRSSAMTEAAIRLAFAHDGRRLAIGGARGALVVLDRSAGAELTQLAGHAAGIEALAFSADGRLLAVGSSDSAASIWDVASGVRLRRFVGSRATVRSVSFSPDGRTLLSLAYGEPVRRWRVDPLPELLAWVEDRRYVPALSCAERETISGEPCATP